MTGATGKGFMCKSFIFVSAHVAGLHKNTPRAQWVLYFRDEDKMVLAKGFSTESSVTPKETNIPQDIGPGSTFGTQSATAEGGVRFAKPPSKNPLLVSGKFSTLRVVHSLAHCDLPSQRTLCGHHLVGNCRHLFSQARVHGVANMGGVVTLRRSSSLIFSIVVRVLWVVSSTFSKALFCPTLPIFEDFLVFVIKHELLG